MVAYDTALVAMSKGREEVPQLFGAWVVTANFFSALEVPIALGRGFRDDEDRVAGASPVAIISHSLWQRHFHSDAAIVGTRVTLGTREFTIVGVAPARFAGTELYFHPDLYVPLTMSRDVQSTIPANFLDDRLDCWLTVVGRLKRGTSVQQASADVSALALSLAASHPDTNKNRTAMALPEVTVRGRLDAGAYKGAGLMLALVGLVLLIACANIANLLLSRAAGRTKEIAMRLALGASRGRLLQQLLTESLLLSMLGGALGLLVVVLEPRGRVVDGPHHHVRHRHAARPGHSTRRTRAGLYGRDLAGHGHPVWRNAGTSRRARRSHSRPRRHRPHPADGGGGSRLAMRSCPPRWRWPWSC